MSLSSDNLRTKPSGTNPAKLLYSTKDWTMPLRMLSPHPWTSQRNMKNIWIGLSELEHDWSKEEPSDLGLGPSQIRMDELRELPTQAVIEILEADACQWAADSLISQRRREISGEQREDALSVARKGILLKTLSFIQNPMLGLETAEVLAGELKEFQELAQKEWLHLKQQELMERTTQESPSPWTP